MDSYEEETFSQSSDANKTMSRLQVYKNLMLIGIMNLLQYSATIPTNALVTSTAGKTLGYTAYSLNYFFSAIFALLSIPVLNSQIKEKEILCINNVSLIIFTIGNLYISYYTLIPASFFHGLSTAMAFITSAVYVNKLAVHYAEAYKLDSNNTISYFGGILLAFSLVGYLLGNGTTSGILTLLKSESNNGPSANGNISDLNVNETDLINNAINYTNSDDDSDEDCYTNDDAIEFTVLTESVLRGIIVTYSILALLTTLLLDNFDKYYRIKYVLTLQEKVLEVIKLLWPSIKSTFKVATKKKMFLSFPLFVTIAVANGFIFATYTKVYIAECIGVHFVGYIIMAYGVSSSLGSFLDGKLLGLVNYNILVIENVALHCGIFLFLIIWERQSNYFVLFLVPLICGFCNGAWLAIIYSEL